MNMLKVLEAAGCEVDYNPQQTCCGQPAYNAGFWEDAKRVAEKFVREESKQLQKNDCLVAPSASCVGFVQNGIPKIIPAGEALHRDVQMLGTRTYEFSDFLVRVLNKTQFAARLEGKATYHDACSALRECGIKAAPRTLLANVQGLELVESPDAEVCCGFGGTFAVKFEPISVAMAEQKVESALALGAKYIISTDLSCLMHLDGYIKHKKYPIQVMHIADVLATGL
jgi:L-lactate dehydrogenase complex protein LldE